MSREPTSKPEEGFAQRWSRLKAESRETKPASLVPRDETRAGEREEGRAESFDRTQLPSIESLTKDSDYSMFLRAEVPEELRRQALRKLWASDPVLVAPDPFDMHNLDYNKVFAVGEAVKTALQTAREITDAVASEPSQSEGAPPAAPGESQSKESAAPAPETVSKAQEPA